MYTSPYSNDPMDQVMANMPPDVRDWLMTLPPNERMAVVYGTAIGILIIFGLITAAIAGSKGRNTVGWFFIGFFFTIIGIIVAAVMPSLRYGREATPVQVIHTGYAPPPPPPTYGRDVASGSAADEIAKAKSLLDDGAITRAEFETIKARALARG